MSLTLKKRRIQGQTFTNQVFERMDLSSMLAFGSTWEGCTFVSCDLSPSDFRNNKLIDCRFLDCDMKLTSFFGATLRLVTFERCSLKNSNFSGIHPLDGVTFKDCQMQDSVFTDSTVREIDFNGCNLHNADLRFIECANPPRFVGSNLWNASVKLGCTFFGGTFDERSCNLLLAMLARVHPSEEKSMILEKLAGKSLGVIRRLMDGRSDDTTTDANENLEQVLQ